MKTIPTKSRAHAALRTIAQTTGGAVMAWLVFISSSSYADNVLWRGQNLVNSNWDNTTVTNWFDSTHSDNTNFVAGDNVTFDDSGIANPVILPVAVEPGSVTISANTINYTFTGAGSITNLSNPAAGTNIVGLTKNNNGTLTILTTNGYTGVTTLNGGIVSVAQLANGGSASSIGAAGAGSTNLVFNGGELQYTGPNGGFNHGATLNANGGTLAVANAAGVLTNSGVITGVGSLTVSGNGTLALSGANTYSGGMAVNAGATVRSLNGAAFGAGNITNNGTLLFGANSAVGNNISGAGILTNAPGVTTILSGSNTFTGVVYNGTTNLAVSTLIISNSAALNGTPEVILAGGSSSTLEMAAPPGTGPTLTLPASVTLVMETGNNFANRAALANAVNPCTWNGPIQFVDVSGSAGGDFCSFSSASAAAPLIINGNVTIGGAGVFNGNGPTFAGVGGVMNGTISTGPASLLNINAAGGSWTINSTGNIWGISDIASGKIILGANNALDPNVPVEFGAAGTTNILDMDGYSQQVAGLVNNATGKSTTYITNSSPLLVTLTYSNPADFYESVFVTNGVNGVNYAGNYTNFSGGIAGKIGVTVAAGILNLNGTNAYYGATTISNGAILALTGNGSISNSANIIIGPNATFSQSSVIGAGNNPFALGSAQTLTGAGASGTLAGNITMQPGSSLVLNYNGATPTLIVTNGTFTCNNSGVVTINVPGSLPIGSSFSYLLVSNGPNGTVAGTVPISVVVNGVSDVAGSLVINGAGLVLTVTNYTPKDLEWRGAVSTNWDTVTTNWYDTDLTALDFTNFSTLDNVTFDDNVGVSNNLVNFAGTLQPGMVTVSANNTNYTFSGSGGIVGGSGLTMSGNSTLTILTTNSYTGVTALNGGIVSINNLAIGGAASAIGAAGSGSGNVVLNGGQLQYTGPSVAIDRGATLGANGGTVAVTTPDSVLMTSGTIAGNNGGGLTVPADNGILALAGINSYNGPTIVNNGGTLELSGGTFGAGNVTNNGTLLFSGPNTVGNYVTGTGVLTNAPGGTLTLSGTNTDTGNIYSGVTNLTVTTVIVANSAALAPNTSLTVAGGNSSTLSIAAGVSTPSNVTLYAVSGNNNGNRSTLNFLGAGGAWNGTMVLEGDGKPSGSFAQIAAPGGAVGIVNGNTTSVTNGPTTFNGQIDIRGVNSQGVVNGQFTLGPGILWALNDGATWVLNSQSNTWGISDLANGKITLGADNALDPNVPLEGNSTGILDQNGHNQLVAGLATAGSGNMLVTNSSAVYATLIYSNPANFYQAIGFTNNLGVDGVATNFAGTYTNFPGIIAGNLGLTVAAGILNLSSSNTYTGTTTITNGTVLMLTGSGSIGHSTNIILGTSTTFSASGQTLNPGQTLTGSGAPATIAGTLNLGGAALTLNNYVINVPALTVSNGTLTLSGNAVTINVSGSPTLAQASYLLISTTAGGVVSGTLPNSVIVNGAANGPNSFGAYLTIQGGQLYLTISQVPVILTQFPVTYTNLFTLYSGASPIFSIPGVNGASPFTYQWFTNGILDGAATATSLQLTNVRSSFANDYCIVGNSYGTATSFVWSASVIADPTNSNGALANYPSNVLALSPVAYWRMNETDDGLADGNPGALTHDYAGGNDGLYTNVILSQPGYNPFEDPSDTSASFGTYPSYPSTAQGYAGSVQGVDVSATNGANGEFTVEAWANALGAQSANDGIVAKGYFGQEEFVIDAGAPNGAFRFTARSAAGVDYIANSTVNTSGLWHYLAGVCDEANSNISFYVDGLLVARTNIPSGSGIYNASLTPLTIGARASSASSGVNNQFYGNINDVSVFNYALSSNQIAAEYLLAGPFAPTITGQLPATDTNLFSLYGGVNPVFTLTAAGTAPLTYQWFTNGVLDAADATNTLAMTNVQVGVFSNYCIVSNAAGSATSVVWSAQVLPDPTAPYPSTVLALNPIGYWRLNEPDDNANDGNPGLPCLDYAGGNDGIYTNVLLGQPGYNPLSDPSDSSAYFGDDPAGSSDFGDEDANSIAGINFGSPVGTSVAFTVEAWVNGYSQSSDAGLVTLGWGGGGEQFNLDTGANDPAHDFRFFIRDASGTVHSVSSTVGPLFGIWHHLAGVVDEISNHDVALYVDGQLVGTAALAAGSGILPSTYPMSIGARQSSQTSLYNDQFVGDMNDVAIFNYALSPIQVENEYVAGGGTNAPYFNPQPSATASGAANSTLVIPVTALGALPLGYWWTNVTTGVGIASGTTNNASGDVTLNYPNVPANWDGNTMELTVSNAYGMTNAMITLSIANINPNPTNIVFGVTNKQLYLTWPADHTGWQLQAQTNKLSVGISTNWVNLTGSTGTNQVVVPVNLTNGSMFYRLVY